MPTSNAGRTVLTRSASQMVDVDLANDTNVGFMTPMHSSQSMFSDLVDSDSPLRDLSLETAYAKVGTLLCLIVGLVYASF